MEQQRDFAYEYLCFYKMCAKMNLTAKAKRKDDLNEKEDFAGTFYSYIWCDGAC